MQEKLIITSDASAVLGDLKRINKGLDNTQRKAHIKPKASAGNASSGGSGMAGKVAQSFASKVPGADVAGDILTTVATRLGLAVGGLAGAVGLGVAAVVAHAVAVTKAQKELIGLRDQAVAAADDLVDKGQALDYEGGQGMEAAGNLQQVLIRSGFSQADADKTISAYAASSRKMTAEDRQNLGISGMKGDEAIATLLDKLNDPAVSESMKETILEILGIDGKKKGTLAAVAKKAGVGAVDMLMAERQDDLSAAEQDAINELNGKRELDISKAKHRQIMDINSQGRAQIDRDTAYMLAGLERQTDQATQRKGYIEGKIGGYSDELKYGASATANDYKAMFGDVQNKTAAGALQGSEAGSAAGAAKGVVAGFDRVARKGVKLVIPGLGELDFGTWK